MTSLNKQKPYNLTLKAILKSEVVGEKFKYFSNKHLSKFIISSEDTKYICIDPAKDMCLQEIKDLFISIAETNKVDLNIDLDSFHKATKIEVEDLFTEANICLSVFSKIPFLKKNSMPSLTKYNLITNNNISDDLINKNMIIIDSLENARYFQEMPSNFLTPENFCNLVKVIAEDVENLNIKILDKKQITKNNMGLLLGVNAGSDKEPRLLVLEYNGNKSSSKKTAFVGKGITFDTGGYNIKVQDYMRNMKFDMGGAAITAFSLIALAKLKINKNIVGVCGLTENTIGPSAIHTDDILTSMSGQTVEILNTDAEGRLVLGDCVYYAENICKATEIITIATLTGAIQIALGHDYTGVFSNDESLYSRFFESSIKANENIWRLPLTHLHTQRLRKSRNADINQIPPGGASRKAASSLAAAFMQLFIKKGTPYLHLDIAGTDVDDKVTNNSRACMLRTFVEYGAK